MPKRHWNGQFAPFIALIGGLAVITLIALTVSYSKGYQAADKRHQAQRAANNAAQKNYQECVSKPTPQEAVECYQRSEQTSREDQRADQDLNAQREMADWAEGMLWATLFVGISTIGITALGVVYVRETLWETRRIGKSQVRAYVVLADYYIEGSLQPPKFVLEFKNTGQSPARDVRARIGYSTEPIVLPMQVNLAEPHSKLEIGAGLPQKIEFQPPDLTRDNLMLLLYGDDPAWLACRVEYYDVFDDAHYTQSVIMLNGNGDGTISTTLAEEGNESS